MEPSIAKHDTASNPSHSGKNKTFMSAWQSSDVFQVETHFRTGKLQYNIFVFGFKYALSRENSA